MEELFHSALSKPEPMEGQIENLLATAQNLKLLGCAMNKKVIAFTIVMALLESINTLKTILFNTRGEDLLINGVMSQIYLDKNHHVQASSSSAVMFFTKVAKKKGKGDNKTKRSAPIANAKGTTSLSVASSNRKLRQRICYCQWPEGPCQVAAPPKNP